VDNPHTKPFELWDWLIAEVQSRHPEVIFLAEAFTRPNVMYRLAKGGFTQSYTYFTWRNTRDDLTEYFSKLTTGPEREFFRPNLWPNTPDILHEYLQTGGRPAFVVRFVLAATLGANYGVYGPAFELCEAAAAWDVNRADSLREIITRVNALRREHAALQRDAGLRFHKTDNPMLLCYSKSAADASANVVLVVVNLDPAHTQSGWLTLDLASLGLDEGTAFQAHDGLSHSRFLWQGARCYVALDPHSQPAHIFTIRRRQRTERDFDYFL
jgi:starch synthase (maltosyl-transferring)